MTSYPIILNADHLEFENEHKDTPPEERPDWPLPSFNALDWAKAFVKLNPVVDEDLMVTWFSCALMRGYDQRCAEESQRASRRGLSGLRARGRAALESLIQSLPTSPWRAKKP